jgi:hypothetical protein
LLGLAAAAIGTALLVWRHHPFLSILWLFGMVILTLVKAIVNAFFGWQREKVAAERERERQVRAINKVITEATVRSNISGLSRRLNEVTDWNMIIGLVIHHPWRFNTQLTQDPPDTKWNLPLSVARAEGVLEGSKMEALQYQFNKFLFHEGWLGARMKELMDRSLEESLEIAGTAGDGLLQAIEGDSSLDPDSPRRRFLKMVRADLLAEGGDSDLLVKVNEFLGDNRPLGVLIGEVREFELSQENLTSDPIPVDDFFASLGMTEHGFLVAHWLEGRMEDESRVDASLTCGNGRDAIISVRTDTDSGAILPARVLCLSVQRSKRLEIDNLRAFQSN